MVEVAGDAGRWEGAAATTEFALDARSRTHVIHLLRPTFSRSTLAVIMN